MDLELNRIEENIYEIPQDEQMNVPARVYASEKLLEEMKDDDALDRSGTWRLSLAYRNIRLLCRMAIRDTDFQSAE